jgi:hypothetical protein
MGRRPRSSTLRMRKSRSMLIHLRAASDRRAGLEGYGRVSSATGPAFGVIAVMSTQFKLDAVGHEPTAKHRHQVSGRGGAFSRARRSMEG